jgi:pilus assembly protein CpaB
VRNWRVLTAVAAVVLAAAASVLAYTYLTEADARAQDKTELVDALVARNVIPKGTPGAAVIEEDLIEVKKVQRSAIPEAALTDEAGIEGLVASAALAKGQFVVRDSFVAPSQVEGFSTSVKDGKQAISFSVDMAHGVAGFVQPNDSINVVYTLDIENMASNDGRPLTTTAFLIPGMRVLAVGHTTAAVDTTPAPQGEDGTTDTTAAPVQQDMGLITVEATPRQAAQIAHAMNGGGIITLSLNPPDFDPATFETPQEIVEASNLFDQDLPHLREVQAAVEAAAGE